MKRVITILIIIGILGLIAFRLINNKTHIDAKKQVKTTTDIPAAVNIAMVGKRTSETNLSLVGTVTPIQEVDVKSEVQGKIINLYFQLGDFVNKGKVIAKIDDKIRQLSNQSAEQRLADAKQNSERYKNLYEGGAATKAQLDQYQLAYTNAKIQLEQAGKELSNANVVAPISGYITSKNIENGAFTNIGTSIASIVDISKLKVLLSIPERDAYTLQVGDAVNISSEVYPGIKYNGKISFISYKGDAAHNYPIEISIENQSKNSLKAGTYVDISFNRKSNSTTLQIPREALVGSIKDAKVYKVNERNEAHLTKIEVTGENDNYLVVSKGLVEGEKVVISGQINLNEGSKVSIIK